MYNELVIALNGPALQHADDILKSALKIYFEKSKRSQEKSGHFVRRNENIKDYAVSKVVDRLLSEPAKLPFLCPSSKATQK